MRAWQLWELGEPGEQLRLEVADPPPLRPGTLRLQVEAVGLSYPDVLMCRGRYQGKAPIPFTPGGETVGTVRELGEGVAGFAVGDQVMALGGGLAEEVVVTAAKAVRLDGELSAVKAAALPVNYGTTIYGLHERGGLRSGETLLVLGAAGGTGSAAVQLGKAAGARVIAVAGGDKSRRCAELGADEVIDHREVTDLTEAVRELGGCDVVFDPVGGDLSHAARRCLNWGGRYLIIGFVAGIADFPLNHALLKSYAVVGVHYGPSVARDPSSFPRQMARVLELARAGSVDPLLWPVQPFDGAASALQALADGGVYGKVVVAV